MDLKEAYASWQKNNPDEHLHMIKKKKMKPRTIQLWSRKIDAWNARKIREKKNVT